MFDHESIETVYFLGFQDTEEFEYKKHLEKMLEERSSVKTEDV